MGDFKNEFNVPIFKASGQITRDVLLEITTFWLVYPVFYAVAAFSM